MTSVFFGRGTLRKFMDAAARFPAARITPSNVVDEGWHALILHTNLYERLCRRLGRFVHHWPERPAAGRMRRALLGRRRRGRR
ncbi:hypothetical protein EBN88_29775 [Streptomyces triticirhizae]|uniref:Uncharacterized protein n=1 Tax=Streptomyces triticirhizae TaxID=2483353 RepID=A0A3M2KQM5_9ACTN|nr:hypothetical protein EBN88_29775 [Streptomyces triticirhizae]